MLSGLRFLYHLSKYCGLPIPSPFLVKSDNNGLITRTNQRLNYTTCYANATLASDWDLIEAITGTLHLFSRLPTISHVKGHQDKHNTYAALKLDAQLNVDADAEATYYHTFHSPSPQPKVPLLPTTKVLLHIQGHTVTSHYSMAIRAAAAHTDYQEALRHRHHWTPGTLATLDQRTLRIAAANTVLPHSYLFKFAHLWLPTQEQKSKWDAGPSTCPHCSLLDDQHHFYRCNHPDLAKWRSQVLPAIRTLCDTLNTCFELQCIIVDAIYALLHHRPFQWHHFPEHLHSALRAQSSLGWHSFFHGFWALDWSLLQDHHLRNLPTKDSKLNGTTWASTLIKHFWTISHTAWKLHNTMVHSTGQTNHDQDLRARTILRVQILHAKKPQVQVVHRESLFLPDLDHSLAHDTTAKLRNWIQLYSPAIYASIHAQSHSALTNVPLLSEYLKPMHPSLKRPPKPRYDVRAHTTHDAPYKKRRRKTSRGIH